MNRLLGRSALVALFALMFGACRSDARTAPRLVERARPAMGSELRLTAWTTDEPAAVAAFDAVFAEFERLEALMSVWTPGSDIMRLNAAAGDHPVPVSPQVVEGLGIARQGSEWTDGALDVTVCALSDLLEFDHDQDNTVPD